MLNKKENRNRAGETFVYKSFPRSPFKKLLGGKAPMGENLRRICTLPPDGMDSDAESVKKVFKLYRDVFPVSRSEIVGV